MTASDISVRGATAPLAATFAVQTMAAMVLFGVTVIAPAAAPDIGVEVTLIGTFTSIAYGFGMLAGLLTGAVTDRYGAIRICQGTMVFAFIGVAVLTLSTPMAAVASAALLGLCYGPVNPVSTHILARVSPERWRPMIFSIKQTGMPAGSALAGALLPVIVITFDWRLAIITAGAMALIVAISIQPLRQRLDATLRPKRKLRAGDFINPLKLIWREPRLRSLAVIAFAYSGCQVAISVFYVVYLTAVLALPLTIAGLIFTILQVGAIMGRLFWGALADRFYPANRVLVWLGFATGTFSIITGLFAPGLLIWVVGLVSFLIGATSSGWNGVFFSELVKYSPSEHTGEAASGIQFVIMAGVTALPPLFGIIVTVTGGFFPAFFAIGCGMIASAVYLNVMFRQA